MKLGFLLLMALGFLLPRAAHAHVQRFAVIIGNDRGLSHEEQLKYAASDAARIYEVLRDLGGFEPADMVLLRDEDASTVEQTLVAVNDRIRTAISLPNNQAQLFVYYSGHADRDALHLGESRLAMVQLARLVRGSSANFRLLVLDACRSGSLTRVKGGGITAPFPLSAGEEMPSEGLAFLTASSANEDAQESDEIKGSFFTHGLLSGLLGAADKDGDGAVVLDEAYRYAYDATLRGTSRTSSGPQHPTFQYDVRGHGDIVLTRPNRATAKRGLVRFPPRLGFLLVAQDENGPVVLELGSMDAARVLSVQAGRYFVRGRGDDYLLEGELVVSAGTLHEVEISTLGRVEYAQLVRKGARDSQIAQSLQGGFLYRSPLPNAESSCLGAMAGYSVDFKTLSTAFRLGACKSDSQNIYVSADVMEYDLELALGKAWDVHRFTFEVGVAGGLALFTQEFATVNEASSRQTLTPFFGIDVTPSYDVWHGIHAGVTAGVATYLLSLQESEDGAADLNPAVAARLLLAIGKRM